MRFLARLMILFFSTQLLGCASFATDSSSSIATTQYEDLGTVYSDTRLVVTNSCVGTRSTSIAGDTPSLPIPKNLVDSFGSKIIDVGIDALSNFLKKEAEKSHATISSGSNSYLWRDPASHDSYLGCLTLVRGSMAAMPEPGFKPTFSQAWKKAAKGRSLDDLNLPVVSDPSFYLESVVVLSMDRQNISVVPTFLYYGEPLDSGGSDHKELTVRYDLWSPSTSAKSISAAGNSGTGDETLILGAASFDLPSLQSPLAISGQGFALKHTPWFKIPTKQDAAPQTAEPPPIRCMPGLSECQNAGAYFNPSYKSVKAAFPIYVHMTVTEDGGQNKFWKFLSDVFSGDVLTQTKTDLKALAFPPAKPAKSPEDRTKELDAGVKKAQAQEAANLEVANLTKTIEEVKANSTLNPNEKAARLNVLQAQLALAQCKATGPCS
ncbi:MAG: hypothetical protein ABL973_15415 [Micropepsaceae bacterium]